MSEQIGNEVIAATESRGSTTLPLERPTDSAPTCVHHWLLSEPVAGAITGRCKRCGGVRSFPATPEGVEQFDDYRELTQARPILASSEELSV